MSYVDRIIERFGGIRAMARALGTPDKEFPASTVQYWKESGFIPPRRINDVIEAGKRNGFELDGMDFVPAAEPARQAS